MATPKVDLTNCDREPIHLPGAVQPHGLLLACRGDAFTIVQASDNSAAVVGQAPADLLGTSIAAILSPESWQRLRAAADAGLPREVTIVFIEHIIKAVAAVSDRVVVLARGRKLAEGTPKDVLSNEDVKRAYLGDVAGALQRNLDRSAARRAAAAQGGTA